MAKYIHSEKMHNLLAPKEIVPVLIKLIKPNSVVDVGCGIGTFLKIFKEHGIKEVLGIDGKWVKKELLFNNINPEEFLEVDLENKISINKKFDLAISLEVAEHLSEARADSFIRDLTTLSDIVVFSAAIPFQGGQNHINLQWLQYWRKLFNKYNFEVLDVFKNIFWNNKNIFWFYKQNMVLALNKNHLNDKLRSLPENKLENPIHPEYYQEIIDYRNNNSWKRYFRLLVKATLYKLRLIKN